VRRLAERAAAFRGSVEHGAEPRSAKAFERCSRGPHKPAAG